MKVIRVRNNEQAAILRHELLGQISDGNWENASPHGHYKAFTGVKIEVDPENVGLNFSLRRAYDLCNYDLLKVVRTRMILIARVSQSFEDVENVSKMFRTVDCGSDAMDAPEFTSLPEWMLGSEDYETILNQLCKILENENKVAYLEGPCCAPAKTREAGIYNLTRLNKDLEDLNRIFKTRSKE